MKIALNISDIEPGHYEDATALLVEVNKTIAKFKETRPCSPASSASPAAASAGSGGTSGSGVGTGSGTDTASPTSTPLSTSNVPAAKVVANQFCIQCHGRGFVGGEECDCSYAVDDPTSDPTAAIRADPRRPRWLTDEMLPLPVGTERVRRHTFDDGYTIGAFPSHKIWWDIPLEWSVTAEIAGEDCPVWEAAEVYHVPQPAPADFTTPVPLPPGTVLNFSVDSQPAPKPTILPPAEMPEALRPYWTPESRVYIDWARSVYVYPSQMATIASCGIPFKTVHSEAKVVDKNCTLLPNRTVTTESILGTASAAKAVEQGVADAVEGRTAKIPDPLDQLAAEAQAEGEYGTAWKFENCKFVHDGHANVTRCQPPTPRRTAREVAEEIVKRWLAYGATSPGTAQQLMASITAAIERDREGR